MPFTGSLQRLLNNLTRAYSGVAQVFSGVITKIVDYPRSYSGLAQILSGIVAGVKTATDKTYSAAGSFVWSGTIQRTIDLLTRSYSGTAQILSGAVTRTIDVLTRSYSGTAQILSGVAAGVRSTTGRAYSATGLARFSGAISRRIDNLTRSYGGTSTFTGDIYGYKAGSIQILDRAYSGVLTLAGVVNKAISKSKAGALSLTGSYLRSWSRPRSYSSSLAMTGSVSREKVIEVLYLGIKNPA